MAMAGYVLSVVCLMLMCELSVAQFGSCDYSQPMVAGQVYTIANPNSPNSYAPGTKCRWRGVAPTGYVVKLQCSFSMYTGSTTSCTDDKLYVSYSGDGNLADAYNYCGYGQFNQVQYSTGTNLVVALFATTTSRGGTFSCTLQAVASQGGSACSCGLVKSTRIVGGQNTLVNEYPGMAALYDTAYSNPVDAVYCGASIISNRWAVTAAHCMYINSNSVKQLLVGDWDLSRTTDTAYSRRYGISAFIPHESYNPVTYDNDIGLVQTSTAMAFSDAVGPVCLPFKYLNSNFLGVSLVATGWGMLDYGGAKSAILQKVALNVVSQTTCSNVYPGKFGNNQICTSTPNKDTCQGDSGGPLVYSYDRVYLVGIVSGGEGCALSNRPGISTRVTSYVPWIKSKVNAGGGTLCET